MLLTQEAFPWEGEGLGGCCICGKLCTRVAHPDYSDGKQAAPYVQRPALAPSALKHAGCESVTVRALIAQLCLWLRQALLHAEPTEPMLFASPCSPCTIAESMFSLFRT